MLYQVLRPDVIPPPHYEALQNHSAFPLCTSAARYQIFGSKDAIGIENIFQLLIEFHNRVAVIVVRTSDLLTLANQTGRRDIAYFPQVLLGRACENTVNLTESTLNGLPKDVPDGFRPVNTPVKGPSTQLSRTHSLVELFVRKGFASL